MSSSRRSKQCGSHRRPDSRRGAAVAELAVCLPVVVLVVFGAIESASMLFLKQALTQSAYEAGKVAIRNSGTKADAINAAQSVLAGRQIDGALVTFSPDDVDNTPRGTAIRVNVSAPAEDNSLLRFGFYRGRLIDGESVMMKE